MAGSAVASELCCRGRSVTLLYQGGQQGSSFTNQKWNHSGLLYPDERMARRICEAFLKDSPLKQFSYQTPSPSRFLVLHPETLEQRVAMWRQWDVSSWGLKWDFLVPNDYCALAPLGRTLAVGGVWVPDRIVDFPTLIEHLRRQVLLHQGIIVSGVVVSRIRVADDRVVGLDYVSKDGEHHMTCSRCVVAAGAWSGEILARSGIASPDVILRRCPVLEYDAELVPGLTTCLDVSRSDGTLHDVTLVPFYGKTLAAGTGFTEVTSPGSCEVDSSEVECLTEELVQCFPSLRSLRPQIIACMKTEKRPGGKANVNPQVFGEEVHHIGGLVVVIPGKASFMFDLASKVIAEIESYSTKLNRL